MAFIVIYDACVLYPAPLRDLLIRVAQAGLVRARWTDAILDEVFRNIAADRPAEVIHEWHKALLHEIVPPLIAKWEAKLGVNVGGYYLQRMKTKWGGCNHPAGNIRLNTELVKKPKDLVEYVIVHEMLHLLETTHSERFTSLLDKHYPSWREARAELNALPLSAEKWRGEAKT